jgi:hypothetical protein
MRSILVRSRCSLPQCDREERKRRKLPAQVIDLGFAVAGEFAHADSALFDAISTQCCNTVRRDCRIRFLLTRQELIQSFDDSHPTVTTCQYRQRYLTTLRTVRVPAKYAIGCGKKHPCEVQVRDQS